jgi:hypothetical protein
MVLHHSVVGVILLLVTICDIHGAKRRPPPASSSTAAPPAAATTAVTSADVSTGDAADSSFVNETESLQASDMTTNHRGSADER